YVPVPGVTWRHPQWELRMLAFASGSRAQSRLIARYELRNLTAQRLPLQLVLAVRPFQVNPPSQFLNTVGGVSPIRQIRWDGTTLSVNADHRVFPLTGPDRVAVWPFDAGALWGLLGGSDAAGPAEIRDEIGYASAALGYRLTLAPHGAATVGIVVPLSG